MYTDQKEKFYFVFKYIHMEKKQSTTTIDESEKDSRIYEVSYLVRADIGEPAVLETVAEKITAFFDTDLAYEIRKDINNKKERFTEAAFGWTKFESDPTFIKELNDHLDLVKHIIRFLVVKTTEENTVLLRRERRDVEENTEDILVSDIPEVEEKEEENSELETETEKEESVSDVEVETKTEEELE
jgi:ribosomal protein S6